MSMEINGTNGALTPETLTVTVNQQDGKIYKSIYDMLQDNKADTNENLILDAKDFSDSSLLNFAKSKGLIGKTWETALNYVKSVVQSKKEQIIEIKKDVYNKITGEYYDSAIQNGREISRTYYKTDENGNRIVDEVIYLEYDENGNVCKKIFMDADGNLKDMAIVSPKDETKVIQRTQYNDLGVWEKWAVYDDNDDIIEIHSKKQETDENGQIHITQENYVKVDGQWKRDTQ